MPSRSYIPQRNAFCILAAKPPRGRQTRDFVNLFLSQWCMNSFPPVPPYLRLKLCSYDNLPLVVVHLVLAWHQALLSLPLLGRVDLAVPDLGARRLVLLSIKPAPDEQRPRLIVFDEANGHEPGTGRELPVDLTCSFEELPLVAAEAREHLRAVASVILAAGHERRSLN